MGYNKCILLIILPITMAIVIGLSEAFDYQEKDLESDESLWNLYEKWCNHHEVSRDLVDKKKRFNAFKENAKHVHQVNQMNKPYKLKLNKFGDMTRNEFRGRSNGSNVDYHRMLLGITAASNNIIFVDANVGSEPRSVDWSKQGIVTPVKNQGGCDAGWAFSAVATVEGALLKNRMVSSIDLSEQHIIDCETIQNSGCEGGHVIPAFEFMKNGMVVNEDTYRYTGRRGKCRASHDNRVRVDGYELVPKNNEGALRRAVAVRGLVSVTINKDEIQFYSEGVFSVEECGTESPHAVTVVGYGVTGDGKKYWIVKNSWGTAWGEEGYIRIERDVSAEGGMCGIAKLASIPIVRGHR